MRSTIVIFALLSVLIVNAQDDDPSERFFLKLDYGLTIPLGSFSEFDDLEDGYAILGHGGSLSGGLHLNERWSLAISVHNTLNAVDRVSPYDFNDRRTYQIFHLSFEPYFKFRTYPSLLYLKPMIGFGSRTTPWYRLSRGELFLDQYIFVGPKSRVGPIYGLGGGVILNSSRAARIMLEAQITHTSAEFEVFQGEILTGIREDIRKSILLTSLKLGILLSN